MRRAIGIIDSGVGGLSILKHLSITLPFEDYIYFGMPFLKNLEEIDIKLEINRIIEVLLSRNVKVIVVACDLLATVISEIDLKNDVPIIMISTAVIKYVNENYEHKNMLFLAREEVIEASIYQKNLRSDQLYSVGANELSRLVEEGEIKTSSSFNEMIDLLSPYTKKHIDVLVSGSTNLSLLKTEVLEVLPDIDIISPGEVLALELEKTLMKNNIKNKKRKGKIYLLTFDQKRKLKSDAKNYHIKYKKIEEILEKNSK